jgi:hypothetical protein
MIGILLWENSLAYSLAIEYAERGTVATDFGVCSPLFVESGSLLSLTAIQKDGEQEKLGRGSKSLCPDYQESIPSYSSCSPFFFARPQSQEVFAEANERGGYSLIAAIGGQLSCGSARTWERQEKGSTTGHPVLEL